MPLPLKMTNQSADISQKVHVDMDCLVETLWMDLNADLLILNHAKNGWQMARTPPMDVKKGEIATTSTLTSANNPCSPDPVTISKITADVVRAITWSTLSTNQ